MKLKRKPVVFLFGILLVVLSTNFLLNPMMSSSQPPFQDPEAMSAGLSEMPLTTKVVTPAAITAGGKASETYSVKINGQPVPVEKYNSTNYVQFAFTGKADIEVEVQAGTERYTLSPTSLNIPITQTGNQIGFSITDPSKLILRPTNAQSGELFIFADPLPALSPQPGQKNVVSVLDYGVDPQGKTDQTKAIQTAIDDAAARQATLYFPTGLYPTQKLNLKSNLVLYLSEGAVLEASKFGPAPAAAGNGLLNLENINNVQILGRGVIRGNGSYWRPRGGGYSLIDISNARNIVLQDFILQDPAFANVWIEYSEDVRVFNTKLLAAPEPVYANTDGFDFWSSRNILIDNVLYRGTDDATSQGGDKTQSIQNNENINVRNSIFYGGGGFKLGTTAQQDLIRNITYENIDVVSTNGLAGFWPVTGANFENIYLKNIRVESTAPIRGIDNPADLFEWRVQVADWEPTSSPERLGYLRNVFVDHLTVNNYNGGASLFQGYDANNNLSNLQFNKLFINGKLVTNPNEGSFQLLPSDRDGNTYVDLQFSNRETPIVNIAATDPTADERSDPGQFVITRTGDLTLPLTLRYTIRGTARNGVDYPLIPNSITFPAGASSVPIVIEPTPDSTGEGLETVWVSLENLPNSNQYLLGPKFQAVVSIQDS